MGACMNYSKPFQDQVCLITGASRGIGAASALLFAKQNAKVVLVSRTESELLETARRIEQETQNRTLLPLVADVSQEAAVIELFEKTRQAFGSVQILVNNAAILEVADFIDYPTALWDQTMAVNLRGAFLCAREAFRHMRGGGGAIVNLSSLGGIRSTLKFKGFSAYVASKHGIVGLTESLAVEGKEWGIRVNGIAPGAVETAMLRRAAPFLQTKTTPEDIAKIILFLCDESQSKSLNGIVIEVQSNE